jgi:hypothetical protein
VILAAALLLAAPEAPPELPPAGVTQVVDAAVDCFKATKPQHVDVDLLVRSGWTRHILPGERSDLGQAYRRNGFNGEIATVGPTCSLVAIVPSYDEVQAVLLGIDDAIHPDRIDEVKGGILLVKDDEQVMFFVGSPTTTKPAAVRVDFRRSDK